LKGELWARQPRDWNSRMGRYDGLPGRIRAQPGQGAAGFPKWLMSSTIAGKNTLCHQRKIGNRFWSSPAGDDFLGPNGGRAGRGISNSAFGRKADRYSFRFNTFGLSAQIREATLRKNVFGATPCDRYSNNEVISANP